MQIKRVLRVILIAATVGAFQSCSKKPEEIAVLNFEQKINGVQTDMSMEIKEMQQTGTVTSLDSAKILQKGIDEYEQNYKIVKTTFNRYLDYDSTYVTGTSQKINAYKSNPDSVLLTIYHCTYTIKNPLLNYAKQELTKVYWINNNDAIQRTGTVIK